MILFAISVHLNVDSRSKSLMNNRKSEVLNTEPCDIQK